MWEQKRARKSKNQGEKQEKLNKTATSITHKELARLRHKAGAGSGNVIDKKDFNTETGGTMRHR